MFTVLLSLGDNPIAVNKHIVSYHILSYLQAASTNYIQQNHAKIKLFILFFFIQFLDKNEDGLLYEAETCSCNCDI